MNFRDIFHKISYLQYIMYLIGFIYMILPLIDIKDDFMQAYWEGMNNFLIFTGLGISFSTLQDTTKTQNEMSRKIWENPKKGKRFLLMMAFMAFFFLVVGLIGQLVIKDQVLSELSLGLVVLSIGLIGQLKVAIEMFENHRLDKNPK